MTPKHLFFDLDNTLTPSRSGIRDTHKPTLKRLCEKKDVLVVSGAREEQVRKQLTEELDGLYYILAQRGNHVVQKDGSTLWCEILSKEQADAVFSFIEKIKRELGLRVKDENDLVEHRGSQIGYSLIGHHEDVARKEAFDPGSAKRLAILREHKADVEHLLQSGITVEPGGTTSLDFFLAGYHKGFNIERLVKKFSWQKEECLYVGDELAKGRNDESVIGVIPIRPVKDPDETFDFISRELLH